MSSIKTKRALFEKKFPDLDWPSQVPCKHFFPSYYSADALGQSGNIECIESDLELVTVAASVDEYAHDYSTGNQSATFCNSDITGTVGTAYVPEVTDDLIFVVSSTDVNSGLRLTDFATNTVGAVLSNLGINKFLGSALPNNWANMGTSFKSMSVVVWNSATNLLKVYNFEDGTKTVATCEIKEITVVNPDPWTGVDAFYDSKTDAGGKGQALYAFADGSLPDDYETQIDFIVQNWSRSMRISPEGWGKNT